jgi:hypothetical protein
MSDDSTAENRLREALRDPRWALPTWPDPQDRVRRLARRQRIIAASLGAGATAVVAAAIVVPLAVLGGGQGTSVPTMKSVPTIRPAAPAAPAARHNSPAVVVMPSTVGMSANTALAVLHSALTVARITITVQDVQANQPQGTVVTQNPPAGSRVAPGSQINLTVSAATSSP